MRLFTAWSRTFPSFTKARFSKWPVQAVPALAHRARTRTDDRGPPTEEESWAAQ